MFHIKLESVLRLRDRPRAGERGRAIWFEQYQVKPNMHCIYGNNFYMVHSVVAVVLVAVPSIAGLHSNDLSFFEVNKCIREGA